MNELSSLIRTELFNLGAALVGFADLKALPAESREGYPYGISIAVPLKPEILNEIANAPTQAYYDENIRLNKLLDSLALKAVELLEMYRYKALAKIKANVSIDYQNHATILPHKTVATRAGLGWIGRSAVLVTKEYGAAVRVTSVLTDAPLTVGRTIDHAQCGSCDACVRNCPGEALSGAVWQVDLERDSFYNMLACRKKALERTWRLAPGGTYCGLCILVCPWTKQYLLRAGLEYGFPAVDMAAGGDLEEILRLQQLAYQSEAEIYHDEEIPPLKQTLEELREEAKTAIILKVIEDRRIVGSVRGYEKDGRAYIGRLIVDPAYQNRGIGRKLMRAIEKCFDGVKYELFTGDLSQKNLAFYEKMGYQRFKTEQLSEKVQLVFLEK